MDVFTKDRGIDQGRIPRAGAPEGAFVFELGHARMQAGELKIGDYHQVSQTFMRQVEAKYVRAAITVTTPSDLPVGAAWEISAWLNGAKMIARKLRPSKRKIVLDDWRVSLASAPLPPATNTIVFRLELVGV